MFDKVFKWLPVTAAVLSLGVPLAAQAQQGPPPGIGGGGANGDYLTIGIGAGLSSSYSGSDDYTISPLPFLQGSLGGVDISPRAAGVSLDFIPDARGKPGLDAGISVRLRRDRARRIGDDVVAAAGKLDTALEAGPSVGISVPGLLHPADRLTFSTDVGWDVLGAHDGMVVSPGVSYFRPLNRNLVASLSVGAQYSDGDFVDYYYGVSAQQSLASGLPVYATDGGGFTSAGANLLLGYDLDGIPRAKGFSLFGIGGYSRLLGDARRTPYTSVRGSADQVFLAAGVGYTF